MTHHEAKYRMQTYHEEQYRGTVIEVTRIPAEIHNERSYRPERLELSFDGERFRGYTEVLATVSRDAAGRYVPDRCELSSDELAKLVDKLVKKARREIDRQILIRENMPRMQQTMCVWTFAGLADAVEAGRVVPVTDPVEVGDVLIGHGHGRERTFVVTKVTKTRAAGYFVTPASPDRATACSTMLADALRPADYLTAAQIARTMNEEVAR